MTNPSGPPKPPDSLPWLVFLLASLFLLSYPLLSLFNRYVLIGGVPLILVYLFGLWGLLILVSAWYRAEP